MNSMPWFRVYSDILDDRKIKRVCKATKQSKAVVIGIWVSMLAMANMADERGELTISDGIAYTLEDLEDELLMPKEQIEKVVNQFKTLGMIAIDDGVMVIANWDKRQFKSDNSTARVRRFRESKDKNNETLQKRSENVIDTDSDTDTEKKQSRTDTDTKNTAAVFQSYEQEIGALTPTIRDEIVDALEQYPNDWIPEAIKIAARSNARNWSYISAILKRWNVDGFKIDKRESASQKPAKGSSGLSPELEALVEAEYG